jgi:hypothetical protein
LLCGSNEGFQAEGLLANALHRPLEPLDQFAERGGGIMVGAEVAKQSGIRPG